jgi:OmpA-OmpF porin, OOP family
MSSPARRRRAPFVSFGLAFALVFAARSARAQDRPGWAADAFVPSERGSQWFMLESLDLRGHGRMALGAVGTYGYRTVAIRGEDGRVLDSVVRNQARLHTGASFVLFDRVRLGFDVPLQLVNEGRAAVVDGTTYTPALDQVAVGDVRISSDVRLFGRHLETPTLAVGVQMFVPSGAPASFTGDGDPHVRPRVAFAWSTQRFALAAMTGVHVRGRDEPWARGRIGTELFAGAAGGVLLARGTVQIGPELHVASVVTGGEIFRRRTTPVEGLLGVRIFLADHVRLGAAAGAGLTSAYGVPVVRGLLSLEWVPDDPPGPQPEEGPADRDGDGVPDSEDACGFVPGKPSTIPEQNGCPAPEPPAAAPPPESVSPREPESERESEPEPTP